MKKLLIVYSLLIINCLHVLILSSAKAQSLYFPPLSGSTWTTKSPTSLGWCQNRIDSLYDFAESRNTDALIILVDGNIVLEKYFGSFTSSNYHVWNSAGKSLTGLLAGIAQEKNFIDNNNSVSTYLGLGWSTAPLVKENLITVNHLITMTSGLNDIPSSPTCTKEDSSTACLEYLVDAGTRWAYHTGAYKKVQKVISQASGLSYNAFTNTHVGAPIGLVGTWINGTYFSTPRGAARFGLLALNKGVWNNDTLLHDTTYFKEMTTTSQTYNLSYGNLWWLSGKASYMAPGLQFVFSSNLMPNAPSDMYCALGKDDQKIYVVPSKKMVVVRMGDSAYGSAAAFSPFDDELWDYINKLSCATSLKDEQGLSNSTVFPNPFYDKITLKTSLQVINFTLETPLGESLWAGTTLEQNDFSYLPSGVYFLKVEFLDSNKIIKLVKK